jgi:hypothetical protein
MFILSSKPLIASGFDADVADSLAAALFKGTSLMVGLAVCYMGYKLFMSRYHWDTTESVFSWKDIAVNIKKTAPGTFFALFGAAMIITTEVTFQIESSSTTTTTTTTRQKAEHPAASPTPSASIQPNEH